MISEIRSLLIISKYTFFEVLKSKILINVFFLGIGLLFFSYAATEFSYGAAKKIAMDFGLGALSFSSIGIAIFIGVNIVNKEIESRTIYLALSQPITRSSFLIGRLLGMSLLLLLNILILALMTLFTYFILGGQLNPLVLWCVVFAFLEAVVVLNIVVLFSLITNITMSVVYTILLYMIGQSITDVIALTDVPNRKGLHILTKAIATFIPDFSKLNIKQFVLYQQNLETTYLLNALFYSIMVIVILIFFSSLIFHKKELD
ncbi:MAG: ABC transporter permease [Bacteriovoracaceae bacterium]|jgi:ABC-type transport system involved in multi-copper enzyme maturation permease subunit|nr:ABC transporter permease [Bacteriovoracaceae bacterium]